MIVKYMRVSTKKQSQERQDYQLERLNIKFDKSYEDFITGKTINRPSLQKMKEELTEGDIIYTESISRLGRSLKDLIDIIEFFNNKKVRIIILKENIDTFNSTYKLLLAIFGAVAEMERETIQERVVQGIEVCKSTGETKTGNWFGRKEKEVSELPKDFKKYYLKMQNKEITKIEMAKLLSCSRQTIYRWIKLYEKSAK